MAARSFRSSSWRELLVAAVVGAAILGGGNDARAGCGVNGATEDCTGDLPGGVQLNNGGGPITTLNVFGLTTDITPGSGINGVLFDSLNPVSLHVDLGPWRIITNGTGATGVIAGSIGSSAVDIAVAGAVQTTGDLSAGITGTTETGPLSIAAYTSILTTGLNSAGIRGGSLTGSVDIYMAGDITTTQAGSFGIEAASQGPVDITAFGSIRTDGDAATGIRAQSNNGPLTIEVAGTITTSGDNADGIFAAGATVSILSDAAITTHGLHGIGIAATGQNGALVVSTGSISTDMDHATGIELESFNGTASVTSSGDITTRGTDSAAIEVASHAGSAFVDVSGHIRTQGTNSPGIDVMNTAGPVAVQSTGIISTTGDNSDGILARGSTTVSVDSRADILATGDGSAAIRAWAGDSIQITNYGTTLGGLCACSAGIDMLSFNNNATSTLINYGSISALSGLAIQSEVTGLNSTSAVENYGIVTGNVRLFEEPVPTVFVAAGNFINHAGAVFNAGTNVTANLVTNDGTLAPGGRGSILPFPTVMSDDFVQGRTGIYAVDIDPAASGFLRNDQIEVSNAARLGGNVAARLLSLPTLAGETFTVLSAMGGPGSLIDDGLGLIASPALHATLIFDLVAQQVILGIAVDYVVDGVNPNQRAIAANIERTFVAGAGGAAPVLLGLLNVGNLGEYTGALDQLSPEIYSNAEIAALYSSLAFSNSLLSCKVNGTDTASIIREGQCLWAGASARFLNTSTTSDQIGFNETAGLFTAGAQVALDNVWRLGIAGGFQSSTLQTATGATSDGSLGQAGIALKYNPGPLLLAAAVTGGGATYDTRRVMSFGGFTGVAESDQTLGIFSGALRAAYVLGSPHLYAKPMIDASVTQLQLGSFTETGSAAALAVDGGGQTVFALTPSVEVGTEFWLSNGTLIRPLIRLGGVFYAGNDLSLTAGFADLAPLSAIPGGSGFTITTDMDNAMGLIGAGLDVINGNDAALRLSYDGQIGSTTQIHAVGIKGSARF